MQPSEYKIFSLVLLEFQIIGTFSIQDYNFLGVFWHKLEAVRFCNFCLNYLVSLLFFFFHFIIRG